VAIAKNYLIPAAVKATGLGKFDVKLTDSALMRLIRMYCRESGVRNLGKHVEKVRVCVCVCVCVCVLVYVYVCMCVCVCSCN
jgi:ATP-dependent Lon protease